MTQKFYADNKYRKILNQIVEKRFWRSYYSTLSFKRALTSINSISINSLKSKYKIVAKKSEALFSKAKFILPKTPKVKKITFEIFSKFNTKLENKFVSNVSNIDKALGKINPNVIPVFLSKLVKNYEKQLDKFKSYVPVSKDKELEKALNAQLDSLGKVLEQKLMEYSSLYYRSTGNTLPGIGAKKYQESFIEKPINYGFNERALWQN